MRVVIGEDEPLLREGLALLLSRNGFDVVAAVGDAEALRASTAVEQPDVVVTDIRMPPGETDDGLRAALDIRRDGHLLWHERQRVEGGDGLLDSPIGLAGFPVFATLIATGEIAPELLERCREQPCGGRGDLTQLPGLVLARCLAPEALQARAWLIELWRLLRPALLGREAKPPRIWST